MTMNCKECEHSIEEYALGGLDPETAAACAAHLASCPACRRRAGEYARLVARIARETEKTAAAPALRERILAAAGNAPARTGPDVFRYVAAAAAALLFAASGWFFWSAVRPRGGTGGTAAGPAVRELWISVATIDGADSPAERMVLSGGRIYLVDSRDGEDVVVCLDAADGNGTWRTAVAGCGYLAADGRRVFCLSSRPGGRIQLVALAAEDGRVLWRYGDDGPGPRALPSRPLPMAAGRVCWASGGEVRMLDAATGEPVWRQSRPAGLLSSPVPAGGHLYVAGAECLNRIDPDTGRIVWRKPLGIAGSGWSRPVLALAGDTAYVAAAGPSGTSEILCMDTGSGAIAWSTSAFTVRSIIAAGDEVYLRGTQIAALAGGTGRVLWSRPAGGCGPLTLAQDTAYFVDSTGGGRLVAVDSRTGMRKWVKAGIKSCGSLKLAGTAGYIKTSDGTVHALALAG